MSEILKDYGGMYDGLLLTNPGEVKTHIRNNGMVPHGKLFQVLGERGGKKIVKEIACNTVVLGGAIVALELLTGTTNESYRGKLLDTAAPNPKLSTPVADNLLTGTPKIALFGIGTGGSQLDFGMLNPPNVKMTDLQSPIPLRIDTADAPSGSDSTRYFGKYSSDGTNKWWFKEFAVSPTIKSYWTNGINTDEDGTEILEDPDVSDSRGVETFAEFTVDMNVNDGREYFEKSGTMSSAHYNEIGFYTAVKATDNSEYGNIRLYSAISFNNRDLSIQNSSSFIYRLYAISN